MNTTIDAPVEWVETIGQLRLPSKADDRLQQLMDRNNEGELAVEQRAGGCWEYCRMHQSLQGASFHLEHVIPRSKGGGDGLGNLAWACPSCNLRKSDRTEAVDPDVGVFAALFNPRRDPWNDHFAWAEYRIVGVTAIGRATSAALEFNTPRRLLIRQVELAFGLFPPEPDSVPPPAP
jgi:hypothetical protein